MGLFTPGFTSVTDNRLTIMHVESSSGERFDLEASFNRGGEAEIWSVRRDPHLVAKIYHQPTAEHEAKLATMIAAAPHQAVTHPAVAWPLQLLYQKRRFVGYLMPRVRDSRPVFHFYNPARRARLAASYPWRYFLHRTAQNLATAVELIHDRGHVIGDLNESNVLVNREALVTLVDCDSFQVEGAAVDTSIITQLLGRQFLSRVGISGTTTLRTYRSLVGKAEFTAPELQGIDFKSIDRTPAHDNFALAVMIFYLLMEGYHPFAGIITDEMKQQMPNTQSIGRVDLYGIRQGLFPHARNSPLLPPPGAPKLMWLDPDLQGAFYRSFVEGHRDPSQRPAAKEWRQLLTSAESALITCPRSANHIYAKHLRRCPHCEYTTKVPSIATGPEPVNDNDRPAPFAQRRLTIGRLQALLPLSWHRYLSPIQPHSHWVQEQALRFWQGVYQRGALVPAQLQQLPGQVQAAGATAHRYAALWQRWAIGYGAGVPAGGMMAAGVYQLMAPGETTATAPFALGALALPTAWFWPLLLALCTAIVGVGQVWALRNELLDLPYRRGLWIGSAAMSGALLGVVVAGQAVPALPTTLLPTAARLLEQREPLAIWSVAHWQLVGVTLGFGALLGFLQSFLIRQQLVRAGDGRYWTIASASAWLLTLEGILLGGKWGTGWDLTNWHLANQQPFALVGPQAGHWLGITLGITLGLLCALLITGAVLLWFLQGPQHNGHRPKFAFQVTHGQGFPRQMQQQISGGAQRWGQALLLVALIVLILETLLGWG